MFLRPKYLILVGCAYFIKCQQSMVK